ncbi:MAG: hypothetical protein HOC63_00085 [Rhodospirillales bacterium]|jgi:hypothetical protein|nr:hypothetical protein [Rhodospirillales bacterium]MBT4040333.1 hypothetical protein [Rhodospirillales bacterium]MBT4625060.1 hypothetical protein [Rhodospirillales bacterium]MBT5353189.1 hypothetical protein [Rhodospirillales bacterium]MBT5519389.1 hypothetical protein [Rhodospirillales bacterium]
MFSHSKHLRLAFILSLACMVVMLPSKAMAVDLESFFGTYAGRSLSTDGDGVTKRDFDVTIASTDNHGFELSWRTFVYRGDGTVKKKDYSLEFRATKREGIFSSAEKKDLFGAKVPSDPMKGEAYLWARVDGNRMSVYGFSVSDDGGFEMQIYHRTLTENGMDLEFTRQTEDGVFRQISGKLQRIVE